MARTKKEVVTKAMVEVFVCDRCFAETPEPRLPDEWWRLINEKARRSDSWDGPNEKLLCGPCFETVVKAPPRTLPRAMRHFAIMSKYKEVGQVGCMTAKDIHEAREELEHQDDLLVEIDIATCECQED